MQKMPVLFFGHGSPMIALQDDEITKKINQIGKDIVEKFGKPKGILAISGHWYTRGSFVQDAKEPKQIYDMYGFPQELYDIKYPVSGDEYLTNRVLELLKDTKVNNDWGIDHGTWTVLVHLFPKADIPVVQLSVNGIVDTKEIFELGKKLEALRNEGYLIVGSGNIVHNLRLLQYDSSRGTDMAYEFDRYIVDAIVDKDYDKVINYKQNKVASYAVPTPDHYLPLVYCLGAAKDDEVKIFNDVCMQGSIAMTGFAFGL